MITYSKEIDQSELEKSLKMNPNVTQEINKRIVSLIKHYWDCFAKRGFRRTVIGYELDIDTSADLPVCCRKPQYGPRESDVIMEQIHDLLKNDCIEECAGPWGSQIVLAPTPHQEQISNIDDFI